MTSIAGAWGSVLEAWGSVFDVVRQPVWAVDAEHTVCYANPAAAEATGHSRPSELLGRDGRPTVTHAMCAASGVPAPAGPDAAERGTGLLTHADGSLVPVAWSRMPLPQADGHVTLYIFQPSAEPDSAGSAPQDPRAPLRRLAHRQAERERRYAENLQYQVQERMVRALLGLHLARQALGALPSPGADLLHDVVRDSEEALAGVREVTDALSPGALRAGGLSAALAALARRHPGRLTVSGTLSGRLPRLIETQAYLLVAETVERAMVHAAASRVHVTADGGPDLLLTIVDDGAPPVTAADQAALSALAERAAGLDGTLTVNHTPGTGTTLTATIPLPPVDGP
ncbi:PAS domain-containing protein [Streptomyces sp. TLI_55]|uniref:PAS domain-containing sensor histidine kinase n=1 Tax=Streptomyces sp. TLI_55 TaxID=1938861 RepID=UPI000BDD1436|nr:PAS domain-containing protein [Streptomyces sp. TLI_55]SNX88356.1 PAS domain-containing protein [Streptomyces sp. TLI_55]